MKIFTLLRVLRELGFSHTMVVVLVGLDIARTAVELLAVVMLLPMVQYLQASGDISQLIEKYPIWQHLVDGYAIFGLQVSLGLLLIVTYVFVLLRQLLGYLSSIVAARFRADLAASLRMRMFSRFVAMTLDRQERLSSGGFGNGVIVEVDAAGNMMFQSARLLGFLILFSAYAITLLWLSISMTLLALCLGAAVAFALRGLLARSHEAGIHLQNANQGLMEFVSERLYLLRLIRMSGMEDAEVARFNRIVSDQRDRFIEINRLAARVSVSIEPIFVGLAFVFLYFGSTQFGLGLDEIALFMVVMLRLIPLGKEVILAHQVILSVAPQLMSLYQRLDELRDATEPAAGQRELHTLVEGIRLAKVSFSYPDGDTVALDNLDLCIPARQITALVGPSGGGKSTLVDLIPRLRVPQSGKIMIDETPIEEFSLASLRNAIAFAPQVPQLFDVTVAEHIRYGRPEATETEVRVAAAEAGALEFIEGLPNGFSTRLGERGQFLSGGQRQRLDLARVLIRKPPIIIFDEPTAALDAASEAAFRVVLQRLKAKRSETVLIIAHRLSTVAIADKMFVLEAGRVTATGTHSELLESSSWYRNAWRDYTTGSSAMQVAI